MRFASYDIGDNRYIFILADTMQKIKKYQDLMLDFLQARPSGQRAYQKGLFEEEDLRALYMLRYKNLQIFSQVDRQHVIACDKLPSKNEALTYISGLKKEEIAELVQKALKLSEDVKPDE